ncbi:MAG: hypothetical protein C4K60_00645 [Ideonella sp. MAG2]|nr:MAG: hypothetical protein C4K60_00645 [Ideonella sp. MAG2]
MAGRPASVMLCPVALVSTSACLWRPAKSQEGGSMPLKAPRPAVWWRLLLAALLPPLLLAFAAWRDHAGGSDLARWQLYALPPGVAVKSPEQALAYYRAGNVEPQLGHGVGRGYSTVDLWLMAELPRQTAPGALRFLSVGPPLLQWVDFYRVDLAGQPVWQGAVGMAVPSPAGSGQAGSSHFVLADDPRFSSTVMVRVRIQPGLLGAATLGIKSALERDAELRRDGVLLGVLTTAAALMLIAAMAMLATTREQEFLSWMGLAVCGLFYLLIWNGLVLRVSPQWGPQAQAWLHPLSTSLMIGTLGLFSSHFFALREVFPLAHRVIRVLAWAPLPAGLLAWLVGVKVIYGVTIILWMMASFCGVLILVQLLRGQGNARRYGVVGHALVCSILYYYAAVMGFIPFGPSNIYVWQWMLVAIYMALLGELTWRTLAERQASERERAMLHGLLVHEAEQLEQRVQERTEALQLAHEELSEAEAHQRELLSLASHEFRMPAAKIRSTLDALRDLNEPIALDVQDRLDNLRTASDRLMFLANKLITHDRWRELSIKPQTRPLWLREWLAEVMQDYETVAAVVLALPPSEVQVTADPVLLRIALHNLIDNALGHCSKAAGVVQVSLMLASEHVELSVQDDGPGVPEPQKRTVFNRYVSGRASGQGHGLGLSIVASVARLHGGQTGVADVQPHGARFWMRLPRA